MHSLKTLQSKSALRDGKVLLGCLIALGIAIVLIIISVVFVVRSWRGWVSNGLEQGLTAVLKEIEIDQGEKDEIFAHVETLMTRFTDKDISLEDLAGVLEELAESPFIPAAMVTSIDLLYINNAELEQAEKDQANIDLARFAQGLFDDSITPGAINEVLAPVTTNTPDDNDIRLNLSVDPNGAKITALRSADEVSTEELRELIAMAKAKADEAGITETPEPIDLSNEIGIAIARALGEDPSLWLPEGVEVPEEVSDEFLEEEPTPAEEPDEGP